MFNSKLVRTLKTLSKSEITDFVELTSSPYFNKNEKLVRLLDHLINYYPKFENKELERHVLYKTVFGQEEYHEGNLKNYFSDLVALLEQMLVYNDLKKDTGEYKLRLLKNYRQRSLYKEFNFVLSDIENFIEQPEQQKDKNLYHHFEIANEREAHFVNQWVRIPSKTLQEKYDKLDYYFILAKLKGFCEMRDRQNIVPDEYKLTMLQPILEAAQSDSVFQETVPAGMAYLSIYNLLKEPENLLHYQQLSEVLEAKKESINKGELKVIYQYAQNYCTRMLNKGHLQFLRKLFELYQELLSSGLIFENEILSPQIFKNIVTVSVRLKEFSWTEHFIKNYSKFITTEHRSNARTYNKAYLNHAMGDYSKTLRQLQDVIFNDVYYELGAKTMVIKIYFERQQFEQLLYALDSLLALLKRNRLLSADQKQIYRNLAQQLRRIVRLLHSKSAYYPEKQLKKLNVIKSELEQGGAVAQLDWLESQLNGLIEQYKSRIRK